MSNDPLFPYKGTIIREMFLHTADENYVVARWSHDNQLFTDFFWNSVHALEKYMKAVLLINGKPAKGFGHGLAGLYGAVEQLAGPLLPALLTQPADLEIGWWIDMTPMQFCEALDRNGNAANRYLTSGYIQHTWYLHMVDAMVWTIRRLIVPLDVPIADRKTVPGAPTHRDILTKQPGYANNQMEALEKIIAGGDSEKRRALLNNNSWFAPNDFAHEPRDSGSSSRNPVLLRRVIEPLQSSREATAKHGYAMATWLLASTQQPGQVKDEIKAEMAAALAKFPGIDKP